MRAQLSQLLSHSAVRYLLIGGSSFVLDFGILAVLHEILGVEVWLATGIAFLVSFGFNYSLQRAFSFGSTSSHGSSLVKYALLVVFNTIATIVIVALLDQSVFGWGIGKVVATAGSTVWNYFVYRYWIFPKAGQAEPHVVLGQLVEEDIGMTQERKEDT